MLDAADREPIPISLVAHHVFCPRRAWLEAAGETTDTLQMAVGVQKHASSDDPGASRQNLLRSVDVASRELGVVGRCDAVELDDSGRATVVEFKATPVRRRSEVTEAMVVQLALQVVCLTEGGSVVDGAAVYFTEHQQRVSVTVGPDEIAMAAAHVRDTAAVIASATAPPVLEDDPRCSRCSHVGVCLPDERNLGTVNRRVHASDPDSQVVHLTTPGSRASIRSGRLLVLKQEEKLASLPIERVLALVLHGNIDVSSGLVRELLWRRLPVVWCSSTGRVIGWATPAQTPNGAARVRQHAASERGHLGLARQFIAAKIANQATLLRRHGRAPAATASLRVLQRRALTASSIVDLYGLEGDAAARYFENFAGMLSEKVREQVGLSFNTRTRRPAKDPVNAALNLCYGLLVVDAIRALAACGLDPHAGFLHSSSRNKPALALDLIEEFRAPVADSAVLWALNNGEVRPSDFSHVTGTTALRPSGRVALVAAYERRMLSEFVHPIFGYRVTWRRAMEVQARLVLGVLDGTQAAYKGVTTR